MSKFQDLSGQKFGKLTAISRAKSKGKRTMWNCVCECGNKKVIEAYSLKSGNTQSCGCIEKLKPNAQKHGMHGTRLYNIWSGMKSRCYCKTSSRYKYYGERGIKVCDEWLHDFQAFYDWAMANGYDDTLTIDRIDVNGNYEPDNCRWSTEQEQCNNRTTNRMIGYKGETYTLSQLSELCGVPYFTLRSRLDSGWSVEKALSTPITKRR